MATVMRRTTLFLSFPIMAFSVACSLLLSDAQNTSFHNAPASAAAVQNPLNGQATAITAGKTSYASHCAACHGVSGEGTGNVPPLAHGALQGVPDGAVFWYITKGGMENGMPSWAALPDEERWQLVAFVKSMSAGNASGAAATAPAASTPATSETSNAPPPEAPFTDYRFEKPGTIRHITLKDLPAPYASKSAIGGPTVVPRPENAWPKAPEGFSVGLYATGLTNPRILRRAPNGDMFLAETTAGDIKIFRGMTKDGKPEEVHVFATGLNTPFGIAFYPLGPNPQWVYVANMNSVVRFPYKNGDLKATGPAEHLDDLPGGGHHRSRDVQFSPDGKTMFIAVGSQENVDDTPAEKDRADILAFDPDGTHKRVYAYGTRNPVGIAVNPKTGELWCSVNERDELGNNLVPDYITHVQPGGFYGWPWWYMGPHQDPRMAGQRADLMDKVITPDVILQPHNASLEMTFYDGTQFPAEYAGDIFAAEHGSWNRSPRTGYEVIRVPLHQTGHATGEYEDFLTGFVVDDKSVWGRPVGVATATDGSLLVSDDGSGSIWRVTYSGK